MDLKLTDGNSISGETDNPIRLVFVHSSPSDPDAEPDILVISGLTNAFLDAQSPSAPWRLALSKQPAEDFAVPPEVFYFDRCAGS